MNAEDLKGKTIAEAETPMDTVVDYGPKARLAITYSMSQYTGGPVYDCWWQPDKNSFLCFWLGSGEAWSTVQARTVEYARTFITGEMRRLTAAHREQESEGTTCRP